MKFNRCLVSLLTLVALGSTIPTHANIVINGTVSNLFAMSQHNGLSVGQGPAPYDARTVTVLPSSSTLSGSFGPYSLPGNPIVSSASVVASQQASFAATQNSGIQLTRTANVATAGQSYGVAYGGAELRINFTVVGIAETLSGQLLSAASTYSPNNVSPGSFFQGWSFLATSQSQGGTFGIGATAVGSMGSVVLQPGSYTGYATTSAPGPYCIDVTSCSWDYQDSSTMSILFPNATFAPGATQRNPLLPDPLSPEGRPTFRSVSGGNWFDPEVASGFDFETIDGAKFTRIMGLPTGFDDPFEVIAEGNSLGTFGPNDGLDFVALLGHGVSSFSIRNIKPGVDPNSPTAFPIALDFDTELASFTMTPAEITQSGSVPEPTTLALLGLGIAGLGFCRRKQ